MPDSFFVPCKIERGAFSSERVFVITLPDEGGTIRGTANIRYLLDEFKKALDHDSPAPGATIDGFVQCHLIGRADDGTVTIEVPSTDLLHIPENELVPIG